MITYHSLNACTYIWKFFKVEKSQLYNSALIWWKAFAVHGSITRPPYFIQGPYCQQYKCFEHIQQPAVRNRDWQLQTGWMLIPRQQSFTLIANYLSSVSRNIACDLTSELIVISGLPGFQEQLVCRKKGSNPCYWFAIKWWRNFTH